MPLELLCDSDVVIKLCVYRLEAWGRGGLLEGWRLGTLAASRFIIPKWIGRSRIVGPKDRVRAAWTSLEAIMEFLEPDEAEIAIAAKLEAVAQRAGFAFDAGESLLVTILVKRNRELLVTGDKRAIIALHHLCGAHAEAAEASRRVACLEQLMLQLLAHEGGNVVRDRVCHEPTADTALSICFCCASGPAEDAAYQEGLLSYIENLRQSSGEVLCDAPQFPAATKSAGTA